MTQQYRHRGRLVDASVALDDDGVLRDGFSISLPMMLRDSTDDMSSHKPGYRMTTDAALLDAKRAAYAAYQNDLENAWRGPIDDARNKVTTQRDPRGRVMSTWSSEEDDEDETTHDSMTIDQLRHDHAERMARLYQDYDTQLREQWRNP